MSKIITLLIVLSFSLKASATNYYVNDGSIIGDIYTTAIGNNGNPGTIAAPFASLTYAVNTIGLVSRLKSRTQSSIVNTKIQNTFIPTIFF
tara:strand:- start:291 stop:563 length:273 start_codon:yes stop_codon:yes gene_type:complete